MFGKPGSGIPLVKIRGVELRLHPSLLILMAYVVLIASLQFPQVALRSGVDPASLGGTPLSWGIVFAVGLMASVAIHEYGHVLVAQALGVKVRSVTLMMLGGVSEMDEMPHGKRYGEFKLAIIGPVVSLLLALGLLALRAATTHPTLAVLSWWLGTANLALGIFNLLPAFPLDGGRALRSFLTERRGLLSATRTSVSVSKALAWVLGAWGFLGFNFLLLLIAFFIHATAQGELALLTLRSMLEGLSVGQLCKNTPVLGESDPLDVAAAIFLREKQTVLPVRHGDGTAGLLALERLRALGPRARWEGRRVRDAELQPLRALDASEPIGELIPELMGSPARSLPVQSEGRLIGVLRFSDLAETAEFRSFEQGLDRDSRNNRAA